MESLILGSVWYECTAYFIFTLWLYFNQYIIQKVRAKDLWHLTHRIIRKILSHTISVILNTRLGNPSLKLETLIQSWNWRVYWYLQGKLLWLVWVVATAVFPLDEPKCLKFSFGWGIDQTTPSTAQTYRPWKLSYYCCESLNHV